MKANHIDGCLVPSSKLLTCRNLSIFLLSYWDSPF